MADKDQVLESNYDGIREYDNELPRWWVQLFWITTIFGIVYAVWFHAPSTPTPAEALKQDLDQLAELKAKTSPAQSGAEQLLALASDSQVLAKGKESYAVKCMACHGPEGQGLVGPNLTDKHWIHGGQIVDIHRTIREGVVAKGMLAWKDLMSSDEIDAVTAFVWSIRGTTPANPKAAEGTLVE